LDKKIYLVSDSRLTEGDKYSDNFAKWCNLNARLGALGAGHLQMASYLIREIRKNIKETDTFHELENVLKNDLHRLATCFYSITGSYKQSAAFIFGGYDTTLKMKTTSDRLGEVLSNPVIRKGEAVQVNQYMDTRFMDEMRKMFANGMPSIERGTVIEIDTPRSRCVAIYIYADSSGVKISWEEPDMWESISFHPNWEIDRVKLSADVISDIEFGEVQDQDDGEAPIYREYELIINTLNNMIKERKYSTVGGNIVPLRIGDDGTMGFATGTLGRRSSGTNIVGGLQVVDGYLHYYDENGKLHPYEHLIDLPEGDISQGALI